MSESFAADELAEREKSTPGALGGTPPYALAMRTMEALAAHAPGDYRYEDVPVPEVGPGEIAAGLIFLGMGVPRPLDHVRLRGGSATTTQCRCC